MPKEPPKKPRHIGKRESVEPPYALFEIGRGTPDYFMDVPRPILPAKQARGFVDEASRSFHP